MDANNDDFERASTLPAWLSVQARARGNAVAMRRKVRGLWQARSWLDAEREVTRLASAIALRGFRDSDTLVVVSEPRPEALLATLAAHWLGGAALLVDPTNRSMSFAGRAASAARFAFIERESYGSIVREMFEDASSLRLVIQADARGLIAGADARVIAYDELVEEGSPEAPKRLDAPERIAFLFPWRVTHRDIIGAAGAVVRAEELHSEHDAFVSRSLETPAEVRCVMGSWLIAGFRLNFPENASTRDHDRRELAPTLVAGTAKTLASLYERVLENLPSRGTVQRRLVEWALAPVDGVLRNFARRWLIARPLRRLLGLSRIQVSLVVGEPPSETVFGFFSRLGLELRAREFPPPIQLPPPIRLPAPIRERAS